MLVELLVELLVDFLVDLFVDIWLYLGDLEHVVTIEGATGDGGYFGTVGRIAGEGDADVEDVRRGAVGRSVGDEDDRRRRGVVGHHRLPHLLVLLADVLQVTYTADTYSFNIQSD